MNEYADNSEKKLAFHNFVFGLRTNQHANLYMNWTAPTLSNHSINNLMHMEKQTLIQLLKGIEICSNPIFIADHSSYWQLCLSQAMASGKGFNFTYCTITRLANGISQQLFIDNNIVMCPIDDSPFKVGLTLEFWRNLLGSKDVKYEMLKGDVAKLQLKAGCMPSIFYPTGMGELRHASELQSVVNAVADKVREGGFGPTGLPLQFGPKPLYYMPSYQA
jgi:hypothetical protein